MSSRPLMRLRSPRSVPFVAMGVAALLLSACGGGGEAASDSAGTSTAVLVTDADPETLNPGLTTSSQASDVSAKIYEALVWIDPDGQPQPLLAESWKVSDDELTYDFTLRQGVTWHDGKPFTSADIKWTMEEGMKNNSRAQGVISKIASIETPSDSQVVITLSEPYAPFLKQMKVFDVPILAKHVYEGTDVAQNPANDKPVGTGPFMFADWQRGRSLTLKANPNYWDKGKPKLSEVIYQIVPDAANRTAGLETGEYDFVGALYLPRADVERLDEHADVEVRKQTYIPSLHFVQFNLKNEYLAKTEVRQAIAKAVDRERVVTQAMAGLGIPGKGSFGAGFEWLVNEEASYDKLYAFNADAARQQLRGAGVPEGASIRLAYDSAKPHFQAAAQIIKDNLSAVGVDVKISPLETSVYRDTVYSQRNYDMALQSFTSSGDPAIGYHRIYRTNPTNDPNVNATGYSNPEVDKLMQQAGSVSDQAKRAEFYKQAQAMLNPAVPSLILFDELQADASRNSLKGLYTGVNPMDRWGEVSFTK